MRLPRRRSREAGSTTACAAELLALVGWQYDGAGLCCGDGAVVGRCFCGDSFCGGVEIRTRGEAVGGLALAGSLGGMCGGGSNAVMF